MSMYVTLCSVFSMYMREEPDIAIFSFCMPTAKTSGLGLQLMHFRPDKAIIETSALGKMTAFLTAVVVTLVVLRRSLCESNCVVSADNACQATCGETRLDITKLIDYP